jgi:hypothetical protein
MCYSLTTSLTRYHLAYILKKRLDAAIVERNSQRESFEIFTNEQAECAQQWKELVGQWEATREGKNPYELPQDSAFLCFRASHPLTHSHVHRGYRR